MKELEQLQKLVVKRYPLPENTCPLIDKLLQMAEDIRSKNEELRSASQSYYRDNKSLIANTEVVIQKCLSLIEENKKLQITRKYLEDIHKKSISYKTKELITLRVEVLELKATEDMVFDLVSAIRDIGQISRIKQKVTDTTLAYIDINEKKFNDKKKELKNQALNKLTIEERRALNISNLDKEDDEEEE